MKTIVVKTKKVISHNADMTPKYEEIKQSLSPEMTFDKFVKYLSNQNYVSVEVLEVFEQTEKTVKNAIGKDVFDSYESKQLDEVGIYQEKINEALKPKTKAGEAVDYKALSEKQSAQMAEMMQRLEALESNKGEDNKRNSLDTITKNISKNEASKVDKEVIRMALKSKAEELKITYRSTISNDNLLKKIQEVEPDFNIN